MNGGGDGGGGWVVGDEGRIGCGRDGGRKGDVDSGRDGGVGGDWGGVGVLDVVGCVMGMGWDKGRWGVEKHIGVAGDVCFNRPPSIWSRCQCIEGLGEEPCPSFQRANPDPCFGAPKPLTKASWILKELAKSHVECICREGDFSGLHRCSVYTATGTSLW